MKKKEGVPRFVLGPHGWHPLDADSNNQELQNQHIGREKYKGKKAVPDLMCNLYRAQGEQCSTGENIQGMENTRQDAPPVLHKYAEEMETQHIGIYNFEELNRNNTTCGDREDVNREISLHNTDKGSYTELLLEQIRNSQDKVSTLEEDEADFWKNHTGKFMDMLTTKNYYEEVYLPNGGESFVPETTHETHVEDTVTIETLSSSDEEMEETDNFMTNAQDEAESIQPLMNFGSNVYNAEVGPSRYNDAGAFPSIDHTENETSDIGVNGDSRWTIANKSRSTEMELQEGTSMEDNPAVYENMNWREDIFDNMQIQEVHGGTDDIVTTMEDEENGKDMITEEQLDEIIQNEMISAREGNNADIDSKYTPQMGQEFKSREDAHHFFRFYGLLCGFEISTTHVARTQSKNRNREIVRITMKCHKYRKPNEDEGKKGRENSTSMYIPQTDTAEGNADKEKRDTNVQVGTNCPCVMVVREVQEGIWSVIRLDLDHNHELAPENSIRIFSGRKYMTEGEMAVVRTLNANNIPTRKMIAVLSYLRGGMLTLPYKTKDVSNFRTKINREVSGNDMTKAMQYFIERKAKDPSFYYTFDLDENKMVRNIFWREGVSLQYYAEYGDCVSFDTTYMTNRYRLPFAPFCGITGHGHTCIFACAFMSDETTSTYTWIFKEFLKSMGGKQPKSIITDQDKAMRAAIEIVMTESIHRNCFFHIKSKCYNKNGKVFGANDGLVDQFEDIVNNCITTREFEEDWQAMIRGKGLQQNKYFNKMWENKERFIPVYFKDKFFPFLQSTGRSEGTNARIKENAGSTYSVLSCLQEFERMVDSTRLKESVEDNQNREKRRKELLYGYNIEKQAMELYNRNIFKKFQFQLQLTERLKYKETEVGKCFEVWAKQNQIYKHQKIRKYIVITDLTQGKEEFSCICGKFNKDGILCSHILKVIVEEEISEIPEKYIIDRWRKKEKKMTLPVPKLTSETHEMIRYNVLSRKSVELSSKGSKSEEAMEYLNEAFDLLSKELDIILSSAMAPDAAKDCDVANCGNGELDSTSEQEMQVLQDPKRVKPKGRPALARRLKPRIEEIKQNIKQAKKKAEDKKKAEEKKAQKNKINQPSPKSKEKKKARQSSRKGAQEQDL